VGVEGGGLGWGVRVRGYTSYSSAGFLIGGEVNSRVNRGFVIGGCNWGM